MQRPSRGPALTASAVAGAPPGAASAEPRIAPAGGRPRGVRVGAVGVWVVLAAIVAAGLWLRLVHNGYGLPFVYNYDEANHFTSLAAATFDGSLDPGYYQNPSGYTYLVAGLFHLIYGALGLHLDGGSVVHQLAIDPTPLFCVARALSAVLAIGGVAATFLVARGRYGARAGLVAAALLAFAFLPVAYSRIAVTDVGTLLPVTIAVWAALGVLERGSLRYYLIAGAAVGAACGFKYTAGLAILPLAAAAALRAWDARASWRGRGLLRLPELRYTLAAVAALVAVFAITTPFFFVHLHVALYQLKAQAQAVGGSEKLGQSHESGLVYYLKSIGWGFGYAAGALAVAGAALELRRDRRFAAVLLVLPLATLVYMSSQTRHFGRYLLAIYPLLAILAGLAIVRIAALVRGRPAVQVALTAAIAALVLIQPVAADIRTAQVLGRTDTRQLARTYLVDHFPAGLRAIIEPAVPTNFYLRGTHDRRRQFVRGWTSTTPSIYAAGLSPASIDGYRRAGFCIVVTMSLVRGRVENDGTPAQRASYARLVREAQLLYSVSPFKPGSRPVPLHFDFSYNYYPSAYYRPGAVVEVYRLNNCVERYGRVPTSPAGLAGLDKGLASP